MWGYQLSFNQGEGASSQVMLRNVRINVHTLTFLLQEIWWPHWKSKSTDCMNESGVICHVCLCVCPSHLPAHLHHLQLIIQSPVQPSTESVCVLWGNNTTSRSSALCIFFSLCDDFLLTLVSLCLRILPATHLPCPAPHHLTPILLCTVHPSGYVWETFLSYSQSPFVFAPQVYVTVLLH